MKDALRRLFGGRFWALALKELRQIRRDRRLTISLIVPPTLQILLFGFALDSDVRNLKLGVVDQSRTAESRELISVLTQNRTFRLSSTTPSRRFRTFESSAKPKRRIWSVGGTMREMVRRRSRRICRSSFNASAQKRLMPSPACGA